jgi:hypothetical protein
MNNQKIKTVKAGFLNEIDTTKGFMVWSRPGNGSVTHIMDHFHQSAYHVTRIATSHIEKSDLLTPTVDGQLMLANFIEAARQAQEINGKKLVFIFDELSNASPAGVEAFSKAVLERNVLGLELVDGAVILATGMLDPKGNPFMGDIPRTLYTQLPHYVIDFKREAA